MSQHSDSPRVLGRRGSREMTPEEVARVVGGDENRLPTSTLSRDASGRPIDITQD